MSIESALERKSARKGPLGNNFGELCEVLDFVLFFLFLFCSLFCTAGSSLWYQTATKYYTPKICLLANWFRGPGGLKCRWMLEFEHKDH